MQLPSDERELFAKLYHSLLTFVAVNIGMKLVKKKKATDRPEPEVVITLRDALFQDRKLIDAFVKKNPCKFSPEELEIVSSWKHALFGNFYVARHLTKYTVFIRSTEKYEPSGGLFGVLELTEPFKKVLKKPLPVLLRTALLPFRGRIIFDGIIVFHEVNFDPRQRQMLHGIYMYDKLHSGITTTLPVEGHTKPKNSTKPRKKESAKVKGRLK